MDKKSRPPPPPHTPDPIVGGNLLEVYSTNIVKTVSLKMRQYLSLKGDRIPTSAKTKSVSKFETVYIFNRRQ